MDATSTNLLSAAAIWVDYCTGAIIVLGVGLGLLRLLVAAVSRAGGGFREGMREVRFALGQWLALSLELALAADILRTVVVPTWDEIGKLGAIVVLRTTLNYFLSREIGEATCVAVERPAAA